MLELWSQYWNFKNLRHPHLEETEAQRGQVSQPYFHCSWWIRRFLAGFLQMTQMAASSVGGKPRASVSVSVCVCVCVCVCPCVLVYGTHRWCGNYKEEEEGLSFSHLWTLPKCGVCRADSTDPTFGQTPHSDLN